ncbi:MAG: carbon-nitrogen family hydrolase [Deltaproteobacteria bacterium]|nr:carbon-nitrogen family hydrolase [Deltaproteobacteria bacterium]
MKVASIQMVISDEGKNTNLKRASELIDSVEGADLILLPEIWNIGYFAFNSYRNEGEELEGPTVSLLKEKAAKKSCYVFGGSFVRKSGDRLYNTSVLINPKGEVVAQYSKIHLFGFDSEEAKLLTRGEEICVVKTEIGAFGLSTCYDLRFPELYRKMALMGAEMFLVASAWPVPRVEAWLMLNRVRALENQVFLASSNCAGMNRGKQYVGRSMIVDPWGNPMVMGGDEESILEAKIDLAKGHSAREIFPAFKDRVLI